MAAMKVVKDQVDENPDSQLTRGATQDQKRAAYIAALERELVGYESSMRVERAELVRGEIVRLKAGGKRVF